MSNRLVHVRFDPLAGWWVATCDLADTDGGEVITVGFRHAPVVAAAHRHVRGRFHREAATAARLPCHIAICCEAHGPHAHRSATDGTAAWCPGFGRPGVFIGPCHGAINRYPHPPHDTTEPATAGPAEPTWCPGWTEADQ